MNHRILAPLLALVSLAQPASAEPLADFELLDHNADSARHNKMVSVKDYRSQVSAYYFGSSS